MVSFAIGILLFVFNPCSLCCGLHIGHVGPAVISYDIKCLLPLVGVLMYMSFVYFVGLALLCEWVPYLVCGLSNMRVVYRSRVRDRLVYCGLQYLFGDDLDDLDGVVAKIAHVYESFVAINESFVAIIARKKESCTFFTLLAIFCDTLVSCVGRLYS